MSFVYSLIGLVVFSLVYLIAFLIIGGALSLILRLPLIGGLLSLLFSFRGDSPEWLCIILSVIIGGGVCCVVLEKLASKSGKMEASFKILGIILIVSHAIFFVINLISGSSIFTNLMFVLAGLFFYNSASTT